MNPNKPCPECQGNMSIFKNEHLTGYTKCDDCGHWGSIDGNPNKKFRITWKGRTLGTTESNCWKCLVLFVRTFIANQWMSTYQEKRGNVEPVGIQEIQMDKD